MNPISPNQVWVLINNKQYLHLLNSITEPLFLPHVSVNAFQISRTWQKTPGFKYFKYRVWFRGLPKLLVFCVLGNVWSACVQLPLTSLNVVFCEISVTSHGRKHIRNCCIKTSSAVLGGGLVGWGGVVVGVGGVRGVCLHRGLMWIEPHFFNSF